MAERTTPIICANTATDNDLSHCTKSGKLLCSRCKLVGYCGASCQKEHWEIHKKYCKSPISKTCWQPRWALEGRLPAWAVDDTNTPQTVSINVSVPGPNGPQMMSIIIPGPGNNSPQTVTIDSPFHTSPQTVSVTSTAPFPGNNTNTNLWGRQHAFDVLKLSDNEGEGYDKDLDLLFAASADLRNVIETLVNLPDSYKQKVTCVINDRDEDVTVRNAILLLIAFTPLKLDCPEETMLHLWYSSKLPPTIIQELRDKIRPLLVEVCNKFAPFAPESQNSAEWTCGLSTVRFSLTKSVWDKILQLLNAPAISVSAADSSRQNTVLHPAREDFRDRYMIGVYPFRRVAEQKFLEDGLLLPFGAPTSSFTLPNPTLFDSSGTYCLKENSRPKAGWKPEDVHQTRQMLSLPENDTYGAVYFHVLDRLKKFCNAIRTRKISISVHRCDKPALLPDECPLLLSKPSWKTSVPSFDRIDMYFLKAPSVHFATTIYGRLLKLKSINPHAALIGTIEEAIPAGMTAEEWRAIPTPRNRGRLWRIRPNWYSLFAKERSPEFFRFADGYNHLREFDRMFEAVRKEHKFDSWAEQTGLRERKKGRIMESRPYALKLVDDPDIEKAREEFAMRQESGRGGDIWYIEWERV